MDAQAVGRQTALEERSGILKSRRALTEIVEKFFVHVLASELGMRSASQTATDPHRRESRSGSAGCVALRPLAQLAPPGLLDVAALLAGPRG